MKILLSPTKKQIDKSTIEPESIPNYINKSIELLSILKNLSPIELQKLLKLSDKLLRVNQESLNKWQAYPKNRESYSAIELFKGEAFNYLDVDSFSADDLKYSNDHLLIFSGLYGLLKPLDRVMHYRLDIADRLNIKNCSSLYSYWKPHLTNYIESEMSRTGDNILVDLSSKEYSKSIDFNSLNYCIIRPEFISISNGKFKNIAIWSKRMRGLMAKNILINRIKTVKELQKIELEGYYLKKIEGNSYIYVQDNKETL